MLLRPFRAWTARFDRVPWALPPVRADQTRHWRAKLTSTARCTSCAPAARQGYDMAPFQGLALCFVNTVTYYGWIRWSRSGAMAPLKPAAVGGLGVHSHRLPARCASAREARQ